MKHLIRLAAVALVVVAAHAANVPDDDRTIAHALNRMAFGARPGDVERVRAMGLNRYIEQQLHPEKISDNDATARIAALTTVRMSSRELAEKFERPAIEARRRAKAQGDEAPAPRTRNQANAVINELAQQKLVRAIYSERQLQEVLTDFWFNHFNVDARKGPDRFLVTAYERDVIRPRVLGKFRDLLEADAKSPAMLFYLDNWMSNVRKGLNENYGRELMELHTLGVDGGYTQRDVTEVARAFTGWTIDKPRQGGGFRFEPRLHDDGEKIVLGHRIKAGGGMRDGEQVLDILAEHPSTARFIATKLVRRFVSDTPPPSLVDRAAARFRQTGGDLREVMRTILTSPEFLSRDAFDVKVKTPFEFVVSAERALAADVAGGPGENDAMPLVRIMQQLGMPLYQCQPPTGYKDTTDAWVNTGALVARMNVALRLAHNDRDVALRIGGPEFQRK
jgi:uncharacterized protein (DUF1800 family)